MKILQFKAIICITRKVTGSFIFYVDGYSELKKSGWATTTITRRTKQSRIYKKNVSVYCEYFFNQYVRFDIIISSLLAFIS